MFALRKSSSRRAEIRKNRPDTTEKMVARMRADGSLISLWVAAAFCAAAIAIVTLREDVVRFRPGQWAPHDIVSRVAFSFSDREQLAQAQQRRRDMEPRVYKTNGDPWAELEAYLISLPDRVTGNSFAQLSERLRSVLDNATLAKLQDYALKDRRSGWEESVHAYIKGIRSLNLIILPENQRKDDLASRRINVPGIGYVPVESTYSPSQREDLAAKLNRLASENFALALQPKIAELTLNEIQPTHVVDEAETTEARNQAAQRVPETEARVTYKANQIIADKGEIDAKEFQLLRAENEAFRHSLEGKLPLSRLGLAACVVLLTIGLSSYVAKVQPRVVRNHARAIAIAALLAATLLLAALAAIGSSPLFVFGVAPTVLVAMILAIAYDQRFAIGVAGMHAVLVTLALDAPLSFLLIVWSGVATACFLLDDVRTRSKLIEVGGAVALAMIVTTAAAGLVAFDPFRYIIRSCLYTGAAGLAVGFVVLGILPFIEKTFRITTSMTLLELADASHPLLRRLAMEAPGTYNHSLQVAALSEEAAEAIGANSLLCRVASYYHDAGKINKPEYFIENQAGGVNRHLNLDPNLSFLIIMGHVKDGIELAREYNLPTSIFPFIQQHHGTTLVEYFYKRACTKQEQMEQDGPAISEMQYRYPGPKPKSREIAVVMLADAVESTTRAMAEPNPARIESLVHDLAMKRLHDGQFDECDLTMRDLECVERALVKTLAGIYHGRIAYPSTVSLTRSGSASGTTDTAQPGTSTTSAQTA